MGSGGAVSERIGSARSGTADLVQIAEQKAVKRENVFMTERTNAERLLEAQALVDKRVYSNVCSALQAIAMREGR